MDTNHVQNEVLYVEDDNINLTLMRHVFLKKLPHLTLIEATTAEEGLQIAKERNLCLILLDICLPDQNGFMTLKDIQILLHPQLPPIWAVTACVFEADIQKGLRAGFEQYITKPFDTKELVRLIQDTLVEL